MKKTWPTLIVLAIITCFGITRADAKPRPRAVKSSYSFVDLGNQANNYYFPSAINPKGLAVGEFICADPYTEHAFLWDQKKGLLDLGALSQLGGFFATFNQSCAWNLTRSGKTVVGESWNDDCLKDGPKPIDRAFLWEKQKGMKDLGTLGGTNSGAYGCNDLGWAVGSAETSTAGIFHAFYWTKKKGIKDLDGRNGKQSTACAINNLNQIVGGAETDTPGIYNAFFWVNKKGMRFLPPLPGDQWSNATNLNFSNVCGVSVTDSGAIHAVLWHLYKNGLTDMGSLGGQQTYPWGINDWNQVVGYSETETPNDLHAFIWSESTGMRDLNDLVALPEGYTLTQATSINNRGQIVALADGPGGITHGFLLTPQ